MITTIDHERVKIKDAALAVSQLGPVAEEIEKALRLPDGFILTLSINASNHQDHDNPDGKLYVMAPCEIVSFDRGESKATQIIGHIDFTIAWVEKDIFLLTPAFGRPTQTTTSRVLVKNMVRWLKQQIKQAVVRT